MSVSLKLLSFVEKNVNRLWGNLSNSCVSIDWERMKDWSEAIQNKTYIREELAFINADNIILFVFVFYFFYFLAWNSLSCHSKTKVIPNQLTNNDSLAMGCR